MKINIILPTYENTDLTLKCLKSIKKYSDPDYDINIIWVDNNSSFESRNEINEYLSNNISFEKIFLSENVGFIKAVNIGLKYTIEKYSRNKFIGIINNDIEVSKDWLKNLISCFNLDDKLMCVGSISYNSNNKSIDERDLKLDLKLNNLNSTSFNKTVLNIADKKLNTKIFELNDMLNLNEALVPYYSVIFKLEIFNKIGFLNENFNMGYCDDTEFNYRILKHNYKIAKTCNSIVLHNSRSTFKLVVNNVNEIQKSNKLQLTISKSLNKNKNKKYIVYTCISGNYDKLKSLTNVDTKNFDYVCFTNSENIIESNETPWKIIDVRNFNIGIPTNDIDYYTKFARFFKTHPHLFFENYERSIWIDGNMNVIGDLNEYIKLLNDEHYILSPIHPVRNDIYEELIACNKLMKESTKNLNKVNKFLINESYPKNTNLVQSGILLRNHNDKECIFLMEKWWEMIRDYSKRDQLSFNYIFWKYGGRYLGIPWDLISKTYFTTNYRHGVQL